jgi:PPK2 family polyphosphate:nucleotide phosphotransferase
MAQLDAKAMRALIEPMLVKPGTHVRLDHDHDPSYTAGWIKKREGDEHLRRGVALLADYQDRLAAQSTYAVLVVLQGLDASGKDSTIRHVMSGVNPQGVVVHGFKVPTDEELAHDYLWRYEKQLPARGQIGVFNRSHYEEVLVVRVHPELLERERLPPEALHGDVWKRRFAAINDWEQRLVENGVRIVKLYLNISWEEQRERFLKRIDFPEKNWKFSASDVAERRYWNDYERAFSEMLSHTSTEWAPWYVIPGDHKWFARIAASAAIVCTLAAIDPQYPTVDPQEREELQRAGEALRAEAPPGEAPDPYEQAGAVQAQPSDGASHP